jgi:SDR family mycofactocin-dependent oxidoreductase
VGRVDGKVALVTGAARGQGRSHALFLAREGAKIVATDVGGGQVADVAYPTASEEDLQETVRLVKEAGGEIVAGYADLRDRDAVNDVVRQGLDTFGYIDVVVANAGVFTWGAAPELSWTDWHTVIDINLHGTWNTVQAVLPSMIERGQGGSIMMTASQIATRGQSNAVAYAASKAGIVGMMRALAAELAPNNIRVNSIHPSTVYTEMILNEPVYKVFRPDMENPGVAEMEAELLPFHMIKVPALEVEDISHAVVYLASDESRYVTSMKFAIDAGSTQKLG